MLARENEGEGAFDLLRARRTQLALERFVAAQEAVRVIDPVAGLECLIVRRIIGKQRMAGGAIQVLGFGEQFAVVKRALHL